MTKRRPQRSRLRKRRVRRPQICLCVPIPLNCGLATMFRPHPRLWLPLVIICFLSAGCNRQNSLRIDYQMGEKIVAGALTYNVVETSWRSQLGDLFSTRIPQQRYLLITVSATNTGTREVSIPLLTLENENGQTF